MKKRIITGALICSLILAGCGTSTDTVETDIDKLELKSNQEIITGKITKISGNEITYTVAEEVSTSQQKEGSTKKSEGNQEKEGKAELPEGASPAPDGDRPELPEGASPAPDGDRPELPNGEGASSTDGKRPEMSEGASGDRPEPPNGEGASSADGKRPEMSDGASPAPNKGKGNKEENSDKGNRTMYSLTDESATVVIPVGTAVITSSGSKTTFSRLSNGDMIKMLVETDEDGTQTIIGIWML